MRILPRSAILCAILLFTLTANAQEYTAEMKEKIFLQQTPKIERRGFLKPFGSGFWISSAIYWGGSGADIASSQGKNFRESNPLFRKSDGRLNTGRAVLVTSGVYGVTLLLEKKWPRAMFVARLVLGVARGTFGALHNWRQ